MKFSQKMPLYFFYIPRCKKVKNDQKPKSRGGSCLNRRCTGWDFFYSNPLGSYSEQSQFDDKLRKIRLPITSKRTWMEKKSHHTPSKFIIKLHPYKSARWIIFHCYINVFLSVFFQNFDFENCWCDGLLCRPENGIEADINMFTMDKDFRRDVLTKYVKVMRHTISLNNFHEILPRALPLALWLFEQDVTSLQGTVEGVKTTFS